MRKGKLAMFARVKNILCGKCKKVKTGALTLACLLIMHQIISGISPALMTVMADDGKYIYFNNALAEYDKVEYSIDNGSTYHPMQKLTDHNEKMPSESDKIKPEYVYVTPDKITNGTTIIFKGTDSGTVHDTTANYQISSATREWGYDYKDFVWTSDEQTVDSKWNCYFAPALAMQYKYNGTKDGKTEYFIKNAAWANDPSEDEPNLYDPKLPDGLKADTFDYAKNGFFYNAKFDDANVSFTVLGSNDSKIAYKEEETSFEGAEDVSPFTSKLTGKGEILSVTPASNGDITIYSNAPLTIGDTVAESTEVDGAAPVLYKTTATLTEETTYTVSAADTTEIYSVSFGTSNLENLLTAKEGTFVNDLVYVDIAKTEYTVHGTAGTAFDFSGSGFAINTINLKLGQQARLTEIDPPEGVSVKSTAGSDAVYNAQKKWYELDKGAEYTVSGIAVNSIKVGYKGEKNTSSSSSPDVTFEVNDLGGNINSSKTYETLYGDMTFSIVKGTGANNNDKITSNYYDTGGSIKAGHERSIKFNLVKTADKIEVNTKGTNSTDERFLQLEDDLSSEPVKTSDGVTNDWKNLSFSNVAGGTNYYIGSSNSGMYIKRIKIYFTKDDDEEATYTFKSFAPGPVYPQDGTNRTYTGYTYVMEGEKGDVNSYNEVGNESQEHSVIANTKTEVTLEGSYAVQKSGGSNVLAGTKTHRATATVYDYYSDWELAGNKLDDHKYYYETSQVKKNEYGTGRPSDAITRSGTYYNAVMEKGKESDYEHPQSGPISNKNSVPNIPEDAYITFSDGGNTISYAYQGDIFNHVIADMYSGTSVKPLFFGSNSWFTGNERYSTGDRYQTTWDKMDDTEYVKGGITEINGKSKKENQYIYNIPPERSYINDLMGDTDKSVAANFSNEAHGQSNSRGYPDLVNGSEVGGTVALAGSGGASPYFNEAFIEGDNEKGTVLGKVYNNVTFDFKYDADDEYYKYDSTKPEYATRLTYNESDKKYYMTYTGKGVTKGDNANNQFYPFNSSDANKDFYRENLMFGMKISIPFRTYQNAKNRTGLLKFSGDDDVWVYVHDEDNTNSKLALDIGGTHEAVGGVVDMKNGYAVTQHVYKEGTGLDKDKNSGTYLGTDAPDDQQKIIEKALFAIATSDGITEVEHENIAGHEYKFFDEIYTCGDGSSPIYLTTNIDSEAGYFDVKIECYNTSGTDGKCVTSNQTYKDSAGNTVTCKPVITEQNARFLLKDVAEAVGINRSSTGSTPGTSAENVEFDTVEYTADIFFMERGLNSSNLKIAFKTVPVTERAVEKQWTDSINGFNNHDAVLDGELENVKTNFYREYVSSITDDTIEYDMPDNSVIKASVYNNEGEKVSQSGISGVNDTVTIGMPLADNTSRAVLAINGMKLTKEVYDKLSDDASGISLKITDLDGNSLTPDENGILKESTAGEEVKNLTQVNVSFVPKHASFDGGEKNTGTWKFDVKNGWLIDCYPIEFERFSTDDFTGKGSGEITIKTGTKDSIIDETVSVNGTGYTGDKMNFTIVKAIDNSVETVQPEIMNYVYTVCASPNDLDLNMSTLVAQKGENDRNVYYVKRNWQGILNTGEITTDNFKYYKQDGDYGYASGSTTKGTSFEKTVKQKGETDDSLVSIFVIKTVDNEDWTEGQCGLKALAPVTFKLANVRRGLVVVGQKGEETPSDSVLSSQEKETSNGSKKWYDEKEMLADNSTYNGETYKCNYYIEAEKVHDNITNYKTSYYAVDETTDDIILPALTPVTLQGSEDPNKEYYMFEDSTNISKIRIVNTPVKPLKLDKNWVLVTPNSVGDIDYIIYRGIQKTDDVDVDESSIEVYQKIRFKPDQPDSDKIKEIDESQDLNSVKVQKKAELYKGLPVKVYLVSINEKGEEQEELLAICTEANGGVTWDTHYDDLDDDPLSNIDTVWEVNWNCTLGDVPLYDSETGNKYVYFAVEDENKMNAERKDIDPDDPDNGGSSDPDKQNRIRVYYSVTGREVLDNAKAKALGLNDGSEDESKGYTGSNLIYRFADNDDSLSFEVENVVPEPRRFDLVISKKAKSDTGDGTPLGGAKFKLSRKAVNDPDSEWKEVATGVTYEDGDQKGKLVFYDNGVMGAGSSVESAKDYLIAYNAMYKLEEIEAPIGYMRDLTTIIFTVTANPDGRLEFTDDGNVTTADKDSFYRNGSCTIWDDDGKKIEEGSERDRYGLINHYEVTFELVNKPTPVLPGTGGRGVYGIMLAGGFMMIISLGLLYLRKRREYRA